MRTMATLANYVLSAPRVLIKRVKDGAGGFLIRHHQPPTDLDGDESDVDEAGDESAGDKAGDESDGDEAGDDDKQTINHQMGRCRSSLWHPALL